jgi:hypothetical protein
MTPRVAFLGFASLLLCTACPSDDEGETSSGETESGDEATETATDTATDTTDTGTETGAACGVDPMCCAALEECVTTQDCCEPETYTCALEGPTPPEVCQMSCAIWCDPP